MSNMLQTKTAEEILSTVFKPKEFIIDGLLTQGLYVLAGAQKVRKSWMAMDICLSIATGVPVLGRDTIQGTALYLCLEDNYQRLQRRLFQMNAEPIENLHFALATDKIGTGLEEQIEAFKKEHDDLKIVVVDVMQMVRSNVESSYGSDYAELIALKQLAYHLNICILMIHHMRKSKDDNPFNMMTGSTGIGGATDGNFALKETKCGSGKAIMYCQGRDIEYTELRMHFDTDVMRWIVENEPATQKSRDNVVLSAIYLFIRERIHFEGTATELVAELKTVTDEVIYPNRVTRDLVQNGYELSKYCKNSSLDIRPFTRLSYSLRLKLSTCSSCRSFACMYCVYSCTSSRFIRSWLTLVIKELSVTMLSMWFLRLACTHSIKSLSFIIEED